MSDNIFSFIKSQVSIEVVVGEYVTLKRFGYYLKGTCPLHHEKTASFTVSPHKEIFYCFGCHMGGDAIKFIEQVEQCSALEAAYYLAERFNIDIPQELKRKSEHTNSQKEKKGYIELCQDVANWCHKQLLSSAKAQKYLLERSTSQKSIEQFKLGYFPGGSRAIKDLCAHIQKSSFLLEDLLNAHIVMQGKGNLPYSPFEERIIFPIKDHLGNYCGFGGRIFNPNDERPKYYNSHENNYFTKGSLLYGLDLAKKEIQKRDAAILVEGYTDCIALAQHGFANSVATLGTACTIEHLTTIARYAQQLYLMYDGDPAGQKAITRLTELCWNVNLELKIIRLPLSDDPASFCAHNGDITTVVNQAQDIFTYFIETMGGQFATKTLSQKLQLAQRILELIMHIPQQLKREVLVTQASALLGIPVDLLKKEMKLLEQNEMRPAKEPSTAVYNKQKTESQTASSIASSHIAQASKTELSLCALILSHFDLLEHAELSLALHFFPSPLRVIIEKAQRLYQDNSSLTYDEFINSLGETEKQLANAILFQVGHDIDKEMFTYFIGQFYKKHWQAVANNVKEQLKVAQREGNLQEVQNILSSFQDMKKKLRERNML